MRISINWLKEYVNVEASPQEIADALTMAGLEVESILRPYRPFTRVVVGRVTRVEPHPNAQRLSVCTVEDGSRSYNVVCGAPNVRVDMLSPLALDGACLPNLVQIKAGELRGVLSEGMLCAEDELDLSEDHTGIMELEAGLVPGQDVYQALLLDDSILEVAVTPNRADCLSVVGIAREVAALFGKKLRYPAIQVVETLGPIEKETSVTIVNPDGCPRYAARLLADVKIGPSPFWVRHKIIDGGMRPINNVVDVTNYVLMEFGQPLHAFDFDLLNEHRIVVKYAEEGQIFFTLDNIERILPTGSLMICDGKQPVALAGIMGGLNSEIKPDTSRVLIESAFFNPLTIRRTSKKLGLSTEASYRFERGTDPAGVTRAVDRAAQLMSQLSGGKVFSGVADQYPHPIEPVSVRTSTKRVNRFLGTNYSTKEIRHCLRSIEMETKTDSGGEIAVTPPPFRMDVTREADLYEEVARLKGYGTIPITMPRSEPPVTPKSAIQRMRSKVKDLLTAMGFIEVINYGFISTKAIDGLNLPAQDIRRHMIELMNPMTEDQAIMRTTLLPGLFKVVSHNVSHKNLDLRLFELGKVFVKQAGEELPEEPTMLSAVMTGFRNRDSWFGDGAPIDFFDVKGAVEALMEFLNIPIYSLDSFQSDTLFSANAAAVLTVGGCRVGILGQIRPSVLGSFDLETDVYGFDINLDLLLKDGGHIPKMTPIPRFPSVVRDLVVIVSESTPAGSVQKLIEEFGRDGFMESVALFDIYEGEQIGAGRVSLGYRLVYRSPDRSLTDSEVNILHERLITHVLQHTAGSLRE